MNSNQKKNGSYSSKKVVDSVKDKALLLPNAKSGAQTGEASGKPEPTSSGGKKDSQVDKQATGEG